MKYIKYFYRPQLVEKLWKEDLEEGDDPAQVRKKATQVAARGHYSIILTNDGVYSWGLGENYVLGNRDDCNEYVPYKLDPRMFEEKMPLSLACGTQHVVCLARADESTPIPQLDSSITAA